MDLQLTGRMAVVTGASKGIGLATTRRLADEGARVLGVARTATPELEEVADLLVTADLTTRCGATAVAEAAAVWAPDGLDLLVNNAGGIPLGDDDPGHIRGSPRSTTTPGSAPSNSICSAPSVSLGHSWIHCCGTAG